jgi:hypothetical protein
MIDSDVYFDRPFFYYTNFENLTNALPHGRVISANATGMEQVVRDAFPDWTWEWRDDPNYDALFDNLLTASLYPLGKMLLIHKDLPNVGAEHLAHYINTFRDIYPRLEDSELKGRLEVYFPDFSHPATKRILMLP